MQSANSDQIVPVLGAREHAGELRGLHLINEEQARSSVGCGSVRGASCCAGHVACFTSRGNQCKPRAKASGGAAELKSAAQKASQSQSREAQESAKTSRSDLALGFHDVVRVV